MAESSQHPSARPAIATPPRTANSDGEPRRVGVEIEFSDLPLDSAAAIARDMFGGKVEKRGPFCLEVTGTPHGDFTVELDNQYAQSKNDPDSPKANWRDKLAKMVGRISESVAPSEITCPPVPYRDLGAIADLMDGLAGAGATGTDESVFYAFGLQLNPEVSALDIEVILPVMRAYVLLSDALRAEIEVDALRAVLPFANAFPLSYRRRIVNEHYAANMDKAIDDYLSENATRNRELDLLPLFAHIDEARVRAVIDDPLIKPRPTFHYRLPNAHMRRGGAHLIREWNRWVGVERLAADAEALCELGAAFLQETAIGIVPARWADRTKEWLAS